MNFWPKPPEGWSVRLVESPVMTSFPSWLWLPQGRKESRNRAIRLMKDAASSSPRNSLKGSC
jgi:hypothetical protein